MSIKKTVCKHLGHSRIVYIHDMSTYCARCGFNMDEIIDHPMILVFCGDNSDTNKKNYKQMTWQDKLFVPSLFK